MVAAVRGGPTGSARALYRAAVERRFAVVTSVALSDEYRRVLARPKIIAGHMTLDEAAGLVDVIDAIAEMVPTVPTYAGTLPDPDDRHVVSLALATRVPIVTRDVRGFPAELVETIGIGEALRSLRLAGLLE
ncbi:MAG: PIN domain-containing protein [Myxococcota bacterium]|nr:PIN domain-containing protein [Myxococcota bacterium]